MMDANRAGMLCGVAAWPWVPRAPRDAPVPPVIALFPCDCPAGDPGGGVPAPACPDNMRLPTILPSGVRNSKAALAPLGRPVSARESPGLAFAVRLTLRLWKVAVPFAG